MVGGWEFDESLVYYQLLLSAKLNIVDCAWVFAGIQTGNGNHYETTTTKKVKPLLTCILILSFKLHLD